MAFTALGIGVLVLGGLGLIAAAQGRRFGRRVADDARVLWSARASAPPRAAVEGLPPVVRRYAEASGAAARAPVRAMRLRHGGTFRPSLDGRWLPIRGEQYVSADRPGYVWWGRVRLAPGVWIDARDRSVSGEGSMLVKAASTITLADARGPELDLGALHRLLAEMVWFPTAFLDARHVAWEAAVDGAHARATLRVAGREVAITFEFGADGLVRAFEAERYRDVAGTGVLTPWGGTCGDYREVDGLRVPFRNVVWWKVDGRVRPYARWEIERIELDRAEPF